MTTSQILEGDLKLNPTTMAVLANLRQAKAEIDDLYAAIANGTGVTQGALSDLFVVQQDQTTGLLKVAGIAIPGIASYTWAQFVALSAGDLTALAGLVVHINNIHQSSDGIGGSYVVRDASPAGWAQVSGPMYYATFDLAPNPATYPGWRVRIGSGVGIGGADMVSDGTRWRYTEGSAVVAMIYSDILHTTDFSVEKVIKTYALPRNTGKSIMQNGDFFELRTVCGRAASVTSYTRASRFGTANTVADTSLLEGNTVAAGQLTAGELNVYQRRSATAIQIVGGQTANKWAGTSSAAHYADVTVSDMDAADSYFHLTFDQSANTNEGVALKTYQLKLYHAGA